MKKIIGVVFASLMFANIGFAEMRDIEEGFVKFRGTSGAFITTMCIDGYKFVAMKDGKHNSLSVAVTQVFEERDGKSLPAKC